MPRTTSSSEERDDEPAARSKKQQSLAIGAPLTAAFIGGALVFENLANADELVAGEQAGDAATETEILMPLDATGQDGTAAPTGRARADEGETATEDHAVHRDDIAPATAHGDESSVGPVAAQASASPGALVAGAGAEAPVLGAEIAAGGAPASLNFFSINIEGESEAGAEVDPFVQDNVLSRNTITGTSGDDVLEGTVGHDNIIGASGDDVIFGRAGSDILNGNEGNDELHGGTGQDKLFGGAGDDFLEGGDDDDLDLLNGGTGDDILVVDGAGDLALERDNNVGEDLQIVRDGFAEESGTVVEGTTFVFADNVGKPLPDGAARDTQSMSNGIENLAFEGSVDYDVFADDFNNRLTGNDGDNLIYAGAGDDTLIGGAGSDRLIGGKGVDDLSGGLGNDHLDGGEHDDVLRGGDGDDVLIGGAGEDVLYGEAGDDSFVLGLNDVAVDEVFDHEGANRLVLEGVGEEVIEASLLGNDLYVTADGTPIAMVGDYVGHESSLVGIDFGQGLKTVDSLLVENADLGTTIAEIEQQKADAIANDPLRAHDDLDDPTLIGTDRGESLRATEGDDWLSGVDGGDHLFGFEGNDILEGGSGSDHLKGGGGDDRYLFNAGDQGGSDMIYDHEGRNFAEIRGFGRDNPEGALVGNDLRVSVEDDLIFTVKDFVGNEDAFLGVQGTRFFETDELFA